KGQPGQRGEVGYLIAGNRHPLILEAARWPAEPITTGHRIRARPAAASGPAHRRMEPWIAPLNLDEAGDSSS
ncbi:MAG TPA: hypothetical protein VN961_18095, partial [Streptosporangiaceae bacterium]|nr:hypothetical protein [Streptosporangiaceae bacterium]